MSWIIGEDDYNKKFNWLFDMNLFEHLEIELPCFNSQDLKENITIWYKDQ